MEEKEKEERKESEEKEEEEVNGSIDFRFFFKRYFILEATLFKGPRIDVRISFVIGRFGQLW